MCIPIYRRIRMKYYYNDKFPNKSGIYLIGFKNTNKKYIGSSCANGRCLYEKGVGQRWRHHLYRLKTKTHEKKLQNAFNKYGIKNIYFELIEFCNKENQFEKEQYWIDKYNSYKSGYNSLEKAGDWPKDILKKEAREKAKNTRKANKEKTKKVILSLYKKGLTNEQIRQKIKISKNTITKYLKEYNIKNKNGFANKGSSVYAYNIKTKEILFFNNVLECSNILNIKNSYIYNILNKRNKTIFGYTFSKTILTIEEFESKIKKNNKWTKNQTN